MKSLNRKRKAQRHKERAKKIAIELVEREDSYLSTGRLYTFHALIDGKPVLHNHDCLAMFHEIKPIHREWDDNKAKGQYFLTCSCGHAGCAGYWEPVTIREKNDTIQWVARTRDGYDKGADGTGDNVVYFNRDWYYMARCMILFYLDSMPYEYFSFQNGTELTGKEWSEYIRKNLK